MPVAFATGPRVELRRPREADAAAWRRLRRLSREHLAPWEPATPPGEEPDGPEAWDRFLSASRDDRHLKALVVSRDGGELLGQVSLNEMVPGAFRSAYLGYWIGAAHAGRGFAREAVGLLVAHAFDGLGLHRVEANVQPTNRASLGVVRALGFRREGFSPRYLRIAGRWEDHERWALTVEERHRLPAT